MVDKIVDQFVENAFQTMNPSEKTNIESECHECVCKDQVITNHRNLLDEKDSLITEKSAAITGYQQMLKKLTAERLKLNEELKTSKKLMQEARNTNQINEEKNKLNKEQIKNLTKENERLAEELQPAEDIEEVESGETSNKKCQDCDFTTSNPTHLVGHQVKHKKLRHKCTKCSKQFVTNASLKQHISSQHQEVFPIGHQRWAVKQNKHTCSDCPEEFQSKDVLNHHIKEQHSDYSCVQCGEAFTTKQDINTHKKEEGLME